MVSLTHSKSALELGKRLVAQLDIDGDLLASWMAHDIAQRIDVVEKAPAEGNTAAQDACAKAILELWKHRNTLPLHLRPLGELDHVLRTLAYLDVDQTDYRYYPAALRAAATADADEDTKQWLEFAIGLDYTARLLIQFALRSAGRRVASKAKPLVELANHAGMDAEVEKSTIQFLLRGSDETTEAPEQGANLEDRLSRVEAFASLANSLAADLRAQLKSEYTGLQSEGVKCGRR